MVPSFRLFYLASICSLSCWRVVAYVKVPASHFAIASLRQGVRAISPNERKDAPTLLAARGGAPDENKISASSINNVEGDFAGSKDRLPYSLGAASFVSVLLFLTIAIPSPFTPTSILAPYGYGASSTGNSQKITASTISTSLQQYLVQDINFPDQRKTLHVIQGFAAMKGKTPAEGGGDRTGTYTWPGGIELAAGMDRHVSLQGKRVMDLGTGTGIVGMSAVWRNPASIAMTDGAIEVLEITRANVLKNVDHIRLNGDEKGGIADGIARDGFNNQVAVGIGRLRWGNADDIARWLEWRSGVASSGRKYDVVLASEVAYEHKNIGLLLSTIKQVLDPVDGRCILRLTPEITDDARGFVELKSVLEEQFELLSFPDIGEDNSQMVILRLKKE